MSTTLHLVTQRKPRQDTFTRGLSQRLRQLREDRGWLQKDVAQRVGVLREVIANYERGISHPPLPTIQRLAHAFGVTADYLLNGEIPPASSFQDRELLEFVARADKLDFRMRAALKEMILALLARQDQENKGKREGQVA